jgi:DNA repair exonuclease SbcCD ATPase subunit
VKEAISAGNAQVEEARKQLADTEGQLRRELEEAQKQLREEKENLASVQAYLSGIEEMVKDTDRKAISKFAVSLAYKLSSSHRLVLTGSPLSLSF